MTSGRGTISHFRPGSVTREAGLLLLVAVTLAVASWALRPPRLPLRADLELYELDLGFPVIDAVEAMASYEANTRIFIDTRPAGESGGRIPGAIPISQARFEEELGEAFDFLLCEDPLLLYGNGNLLLIAAVASRLQERGFEDITLMSGGLESWRAAGGALVDDPGAGTEADHE
jgi:rhodanese-related sulfurtransferase